MAEDQIYEGRCLCGSVRYETRGKPLQSAHCHCENCRRSTGAVFATGFGFPAEAVTWTRENPSSYMSSEKFARLFCPHCGGSVAQHNQRTGLIWMMVGTLDHPESLAPECHMFTRDQISWVKLDDGLPRHRMFSPA